MASIFVSCCINTTIPYFMWIYVQFLSQPKYPRDCFRPRCNHVVSRCRTCDWLLPWTRDTYLVGCKTLLFCFQLTALAHSINMQCYLLSQRCNTIPQLWFDFRTYSNDIDWKYHEDYPGIDYLCALCYGHSPHYLWYSYLHYYVRLNQLAQIVNRCSDLRDMPEIRKFLQTKQTKACRFKWNNISLHLDVYS